MDGGRRAPTSKSLARKLPGSQAARLEGGGTKSSVSVVSPQERGCCGWYACHEEQSALTMFMYECHIAEATSSVGGRPCVAFHLATSSCGRRRHYLVSHGLRPRKSVTFSAHVRDMRWKTTTRSFRYSPVPPVLLCLCIPDVAAHFPEKEKDGCAGGDLLREETRELVRTSMTGLFEARQLA